MTSLAELLTNGGKYADDARTEAETLLVEAIELLQRCLFIQNRFLDESEAQMDLTGSEAMVQPHGEKHLIRPRSTRVMPGLHHGES